MGIFDDQSQIFAHYRATLQFRGAVLGGTPNNPKVVEGWLSKLAGIKDKHDLAHFAARVYLERTGMEVDPEELMAKDPMELRALVQEVADKMAEENQTNGFKRDANGLYIEDRQVKACLKECTNILFAGSRFGARPKTHERGYYAGKSPKDFVAERVFVKPTRIYLDRTEYEGVEQITGHVKDASGKRAVLSRYEYVLKPRITFTLSSTFDEIPIEKWGDLWVQAQEIGIGALRSQGYGRFDIIEWVPLEKPAHPDLPYLPHGPGSKAYVDPTIPEEEIAS